MFKRSTFPLVAVASLAILNPSIVHASGITNGDFDTNFSGWQTIGQTRIINNQAFLETCYYDTAGGGCDENIRLSNFSELQAFLPDLPSNLNIVEGSIIKQEITANAGDILSFSWNFMTDQDPDPSYNDFAFFSLSNSFTQLADTFSPLLSPSLTAPLARTTGDQTYTIPIAGTYTLSFGVVDVGDNTTNSALLIDAVTITSQATAVPENVTFLATLSAFVLGIAFTKGKPS